MSYETKYRKAAGLGHYAVCVFSLYMCVQAYVWVPLGVPAVMDFHVRMLSLLCLRYQ